MWSSKKTLMLALCVAFSTSSLAEEGDKVRVPFAPPQVSINAPTPSIAQKGPTIETTMPGSDRKVTIRLPKLMTPAPMFDRIVGYTDSGLPITARKRAVINLAKQMARDIEAREAQEVRMGLRKPRVKRDLWAEKEATIREAERVHGKQTTQNFIVPGTTPAVSRKLHDKDTGVMVVKDEGVGHRVTYKHKDEDEPVMQKAISASFTGNEERVVPTKVNKPSATVPATMEESDSAEDIFKNYFKDYQPVSWLEKGLSVLVSNAYAQPTFESDAQALAKDFDRIKKEKKIEPLCGGNCIENQKALDAAQAISEMFRDPNHPANPLNHKGELKNVNPLASFSLNPEKSKASKAVETSDANHQTQTMTLIFVSYSLGDEVIKDILGRVAGKNDQMVVMRGVPEGVGLGEGIKRIQDLAREFNPVPNIVLDPTLFTAFGIKAVPSVVRAEVKPHAPARKDRLTLIAKVEGLHNDEWLIERIDQGQRGDLGQQGPIKTIAEPDMIEAMKKKITEMDWKAKQDRAVKEFWNKKAFTKLPTAKEHSVRELNPSVMVTEAIKDANGNIIHDAGTVINPLTMRPFKTTLVIFNPESETEMALVDKRLQALRDADAKVQLIITQMNRKGGWDRFKALSDHFDASLFLLEPEVSKRFELKATPSILWADNDKHVFVIEELAEDKQKGGGQ